MKLHLGWTNGKEEVEKVTIYGETSSLRFLCGVIQKGLVLDNIYYDNKKNEADNPL